MSKVETRVPLGADVLARVDALARTEGQIREEIIVGCVGRAVAARSMRDLLDRAAAANVSEEEALRIAYDEIRSSRREGESRGFVPSDS